MAHPVITPSSRSVTVTSTGGTRFVVPFPVFDYGDLVVTVSEVEVENWRPDGDPLKCGIAGSGAILFDAPVSGPVTITSRSVPKRTRDYVDGAGVPADVLNTDLDRLFAHGQEAFRDIRSAEAVIEALKSALLKALRFPVDIPVTPAGSDCMVLSWRDGKPAWKTWESLLAWKHAVSHPPLHEITLHDVKTRGVFFGRQPRLADTQPLVTYDFAVADLPEGVDLCERVKQPPTIDDPFSIMPCPYPPVVETVKPDADGTVWGFRYRVPLNFAEGCC